MSAPAPSWRTIRELEQTRWLRFVVEHAGEDDLCAALVGARTITQQQAALLAGRAAANGWGLPRIGGPARPRRRRRT